MKIFHEQFTVKAQKPLLVCVSVCVQMAAIGDRHLHLSQCDQTQNCEGGCDNYLFNSWCAVGNNLTATHSDKHFERLPAMQTFIGIANI